MFLKNAEGNVLNLSSLGSYQSSALLLTTTFNQQSSKNCIRTLWPIKLVFDLLEVLLLIDLFYRYCYLPSILIDKLND